MRHGDSLGAVKLPEKIVMIFVNLVIHFFFFNDTATPEIYTLPPHDALPISAATSAVFLALQPGDHVVAPTDAYHGTSRLLRETFSRWGLEATFVDMTDAAAVRRAIKPSTR